MANNVNYGAARVMRAAIMHTTGNGRKFTNIGTLQALRSPQNSTLTTAMSPEVATGEKRLSLIQGAGGEEDIFARIQLNYSKQYTPSTVKNTRTVSQTGETPKAPTVLDVDYKLHKEYDLHFRTVDFATLEDEAEKYFTQTNQGGLNTTIGEFKTLGLIGKEFMDSVEGGLLIPMNKSLVAPLITGIGNNLITGTTTATDIALYNTEGHKLEDFFDFLNNIKTVHSITGNLIVIGGLKLVTYMRKAKIASPNDLGTDTQKMFAELPVEWYYDPEIDVQLGQDKVLIIDPNSACFQTILEHVHVVKQKKVAQTSFGTAAVQVSQMEAETVVLDIDIRVREYDDSKYPKWIVTPSARYGMFVRPAGFFKNYGGWNTVTGIFQAKLHNTATTFPTTP
ncbi:hypothetical protein [Tellurirhabdus bombi]|uniref:hypothetical protein n=1 Tax=Tellurirhabdus bombi TaxID=2907205 RepID=UPI001F16B2F4|nr:hypothetical protein [Tellurirhabdus bombi]